MTGVCCDSGCLHSIVLYCAETTAVDTHTTAASTHVDTIETHVPASRYTCNQVCAPVSRLADLIGESKAQLDASWLPCPIVAHAGDGNFHVFIFFDASKPEDVKEAKRLSSHMVD
eukprot:2664-Heterococcus_DN1.PRE.1